MIFKEENIKPGDARTPNHASICSFIRSNIIGNRYTIQTPFGAREIVYADYTASGRALEFVETYMIEEVAPVYANTHTEASATGSQTTKLRENSRNFIRKALNAPADDYALLFTGTGSTAAIDKLFRCLGINIPEYAEKKWELSKHIPDPQRPVVFIGHFEHHSNELFWRESIARCVVIKEHKDGSPNLSHLEAELIKYKEENVPMIGTFSAGSNVTGIRSPVRNICKLLHKHGAYAFIDFAGTGPYVNINMKSDKDDSRKGGDSSIDAAFFSPHKFIGGPGASGLLVARHKLFQNAFGIETRQASSPGGGTIQFVDRLGHSYSNNIEAREDSGTPGIMQSIRAGLAFKVKEMVGTDMIEKAESLYCAMALNAWTKSPYIALMGADRSSYHLPTRRVPIFSFNVLSPVPRKPSSPLGPEDQHFVGFKRTINDVVIDSLNRIARKNCVSQIDFPLHHDFVVALLNDVYGIQARGGCSCAGPYGFDLFGIPTEVYLNEKNNLHKVFEVAPAVKFGWARVNFNYFISKSEVTFIVEAIQQIAAHGWLLLPQYVQDLKTGQFIHWRSFSKRRRGGHGDNDKKRTPNVFEISFDSGIEPPINQLLHHVRKKITKSSLNTPRSTERTFLEYRSVLSEAKRLYDKEATRTRRRKVQDFTTDLPAGMSKGDIWWLTPTQAETYLASISRGLKTKRSHISQHSPRRITSRRVTLKNN